MDIFGGIMKLHHSLIITFALGIFAFNGHGEEYKAPKLKFKSTHKTKSYNVAKEKDFRDFNENSYRVQESDYSDRNVASEVEPDHYEQPQADEGRNPSSAAKTDTKEAPKAKPSAGQEFKPQPWKYNK
jgi:hypothetical protein